MPEERPNVEAEIQRLQQLLEESKHTRLQIEKNREKLRRAIARLRGKAATMTERKPAPKSEAGGVQESDG